MLRALTLTIFPLLLLAPAMAGLLGGRFAARQIRLKCGLSVKSSKL